eukprot:GHVU01161016.1.p1 GENE.GHVU01161016.1~~GHVU01161016.1.p1  ORF type:complete len:172 (+),score=27.61 GHVU01161016.1:96-611(+)
MGTAAAPPPPPQNPKPLSTPPAYLLCSSIYCLMPSSSCRQAVAAIPAAPATLEFVVGVLTKHRQTLPRLSVELDALVDMSSQAQLPAIDTGAMAAAGAGAAGGGQWDPKTYSLAPHQQAFARLRALIDSRHQQLSKLKRAAQQGPGGRRNSNSAMNHQPSAGPGGRRCMMC